MSKVSRSLAVPALTLALVGAALAGCSGPDAKPATGASGAASSGAASSDTETPAGSGDGAPPSSSAKPSAGISPKAAVRIGEPAALAADVTVRVSGTTRVTLTAKGPGEVAGPGARVEIRVTNTSAKPVDLGALAVNAYYGRAKTPASPSSYQAGAQLSGSLTPGAARTGLYFFRVPTSQFERLQVEVSSGDSPYVLTFVGR